MTAQRPPTNFTFLKMPLPDLAVEAIKAERNAVADPRGACFYARRALELALN
jgi:type I restriction enzyme, R subunit